MSPGGDSRLRRVPLIPGCHRTVSTRRSPCARPVPRCPLVHSRTHSGTTRDTTPRPVTPASPNVRTGPVPSPLHPPAPGRSPNRSPPGAPRQTVRRSSPSPHRVGRSPRALPALRSRRPGPSQPGARTVRRSLRGWHATGQIPEYHQVVDTIIAWGEQILAYHTTRRRVSNGPIEGPFPPTNNLHQVLRRVAHKSRFTNPQQLRRPRNPRNMTPHRALAQRPSQPTETLLSVFAQPRLCSPVRFPTTRGLSAG